MSSVPANTELEQSLLGGLLLNNEAYYKVSEFLQPTDFYDPVHREIYATFQREIPAGKIVDPKLIRFQLGGDPNATVRIATGENFGGVPGTREISVAEYVSLLAMAAVSTVNAEDYGRAIADLALKRRVMDVADAVKESCQIGNPGETSEDLRDRLDACLEELFSSIDDIGVRHVKDVAEAVKVRVDTAFRGNVVAGLSVGLKGVQDLSGPLLPGRLYILGGSPGSGKSLCAAQIAEYVAKTAPVLFFQIEMPAEEQVERMLAYRSHLSAEAIERAALDNEEFDALLEAIQDVRPLNLWIDSSTSPSVAQIRTRASRLKRQHGLVLVVVDHLLYLASPDSRMRDHEAARANLQGLKKMAKDLGIAVMVLDQPIKDNSGIIRPLRVSDLYGGSAIEQEADVILLLFREEYMLRRAEPRDENSDEHRQWQDRLARCEGLAEISLGKRRGGKGFGTRRLYFDAVAMRFYDNAPYTPKRERDLLDMEHARLA